MKTQSVVIAITVLLLSGSGWGQEVDPANEIAAQWTAEQTLRELRQARLDELMSKIAEEMEAIRNTRNREERETLMTTHRETMREAMALMRDMGGTNMREVMAEHMGPGIAPAADSDRSQHLHKRMPLARPRAQMSDAERLADLENRLDMMQIMMESMMDNHAKN